MEHFYRVRAVVGVVDELREDLIVLAGNVNEAMERFERTPAEDTGDPLGSYGIRVAMVHLVTFGETGPVYEDVTYRLDATWTRASWQECMAFFEKASC